MMRAIAAGLLLLMLVGCAAKIVPARLYDLSTAEVINANFEFSGSTQGAIEFELPSGEIFRGEYQTIRGGSVAWGTVYGTVWGGNGSASGVSNSYMTSRPTEYFGTAVAASNFGRTIVCEYISNTSRWEPHGQGACKDNSGKIYRLMY